MTTQTRDRLAPVDLIKDREYILSELKKSEQRWWTMTIEESYRLNMEKIDKMKKKYETV